LSKIIMKFRQPSDQELWFLPLGGSGEIGMNLNLFGHDDCWLMVDCGITFERQVNGDNQIEMPDPDGAIDALSNLAGIIATHAHEDHVGALPHLFKRFPKPIYTTPFTAGVIRQKFQGEALAPEIRIVESHSSRQIGPFKVTWLPITHSTPETHALLIETKAGNILHTADWKIDPAPVVGPGFDSNHFRASNLPPISALIVDSTNALKTGHSKSEQSIRKGLKTAIAKAKGRVIIGCFASNIARLQSIGQACVATDRHLALAGRSLLKMSGIAKSVGYLKTDFPELPLSHLGYLPGENALLIATGSQGERGSALWRLARDQHPDLALNSEDLVILSAKTIPGNEAQVAALVKGFQALGALVLSAETQDDLNLHASGHPNQAELAALYRLTQPSLAIPVHGEPQHLTENARIAKTAGVPSTLVGGNGDLFVVSNPPLIKRNWVKTGRLIYSQQDRSLLKKG
jgi:ribonuclease J